MQILSSRVQSQKPRILHWSFAEVEVWKLVFIQTTWMYINLKWVKYIINEKGEGGHRWPGVLTGWRGPLPLHLSPGTAIHTCCSPMQGHTQDQLQGRFWEEGGWAPGSRKPVNHLWRLNGSLTNSTPVCDTHLGWRALSNSQPLVLQQYLWRSAAVTAPFISLPHTPFSP